MTRVTRPGRIVVVQLRRHGYLLFTKAERNEDR